MASTGTRSRTAAQAHDAAMQLLRRIAHAWRRHRGVRRVCGALLYLTWLWGISDRWNLWITSVCVFAGLGLGLLLLWLSRPDGTSAHAPPTVVDPPGAAR